jgi:hypothetical protein
MNDQTNNNPLTFISKDIIEIQLLKDDSTKEIVCNLMINGGSILRWRCGDIGVAEAKRNNLIEHLLGIDSLRDEDD